MSTWKADLIRWAKGTGIVLAVLAPLFAWSLAQGPYEPRTASSTTTTTAAESRPQVRTYCDRVTGDCAEPDYGPVDSDTYYDDRDYWESRD